jgi:hypothetical protein
MRQMFAGEAAVKMEPGVRHLLIGGEQAKRQIRPWLRVKIQSLGSFMVKCLGEELREQPRLLQYQEIGGSPKAGLGTRSRLPSVDLAGMGLDSCCG